MSGAAAATILTVQAVQQLLSNFQTNLAFGSFWCPLDASIDTITTTSFDYIIVGGGSAGSVMANRLSACTNKNVLLLEAGGCPPLESLSAYDYNMTAVDDSYAGQNLQGGSVGLTAGKMLGGSSSINHGIWVRGSTFDYDRWVTATGDSSWSYENLLKYFRKSETVSDKYILASDAKYCGTSGPINLLRQLSSENDGILNALAEQGYNIVNNSNADIFTNIALQPELAIGNDSLRQSSLISYIYRVKNRTNLYVLTAATVSKINFDSTNTATGVTFTYRNTSYTVTASSEVILAAGALKTPQLMMLSGVGPLEHLTDKNITVISNLPVGDNLQDHVSASTIISLENDTSTTRGGNPFGVPVPLTCNYINLNNKTAHYPNFQSINLVFPHDSSGFMQLCTNSFKYSNTICEAMNAANIGKKTLWRINNLLRLASRGTVRLDTTDINDQPLVNLGLLSNNTDLLNLANFLNHTAQLVNTTYFKSIGAEFKDLGLCSDHHRYSTEYWQCYALAMSSTMWHYCGTAAMGSVVDSYGLVIGVSNLRVVDASIFPTVPGGNINAAVVAVAEKIADGIVSALNSCTTK